MLAGFFNYFFYCLRFVIVVQCRHIDVRKSTGAIRANINKAKDVSARYFKSNSYPSDQTMASLTERSASDEVLGLVVSAYFIKSLAFIRNVSSTMRSF